MTTRRYLNRSDVVFTNISALKSAFCSKTEVDVDYSNPLWLFSESKRKIFNWQLSIRDFIFHLKISNVFSQWESIDKSSNLGRSGRQRSPNRPIIRQFISCKTSRHYLLVTGMQLCRLKVSKLWKIPIATTFASHFGVTFVRRQLFLLHLSSNNIKVTVSIE